MLIAGIRSLVLARDDVTLRCCGLARIAVSIVDAVQISRSATFIHGLSPRPSSLAWTRDLKNTMPFSFPEYCSTRNPLNQV